MQNTDSSAQNYDYSPLSKDIPFSEIIDTARAKTAKPVFYCYVFLLIAGFLFSIFVIVSILQMIADGRYDTLGSSIFVLVFFAFIIPIFYSWAKTARQYARIKAFALANGFVYLDSSNASTDSYNGMIFKQGHARTIHTGIKSAADTQYELANCSYVTGSGKNSRTHHYGFVRIKLPRRLPHMVLDATANNLFKRFSNLPVVFNSDQKLSLEGDFDKYFTLYAPAEYKTDALYVFTPDIMQLFITNAHTFDAEVIDDDLYLYTTGSLKLDTPESLQALITLVNKIHPKLYNQTDYYADERVGDRASNIIAPEGSRLQSRFSYIAVVVIVIYILLQILPSIIHLVNS
jgi:hypothetical protein